MLKPPCTYFRVAHAYMVPRNLWIPLAIVKFFFGNFLVIVKFTDLCIFMCMRTMSLAKIFEADKGNMQKTPLHNLVHKIGENEPFSSENNNE